MQLGMDENAQTNHKYYFAIMLQNSANHLPTLIDNLLRVIYHLGEQNVFVSIHEADSTDKGHTTAMIETIKIAMDAIGLENEIHIQEEGESYPPNAVLAPLRNSYKANGRVFNTLVMMKDDLWCAEEFLELLVHSRGQAASIVCSTDVRSKVAPLYLTHSRTLYLPFRLVTISTADSSTRLTDSLDRTNVRAKSVPISTMKTRHLDSKITIPYEYSHVSPPSQFSILPPSILPLTSISHTPIFQEIHQLHHGNTTVDSLQNSTWRFDWLKQASTAPC